MSTALLLLPDFAMILLGFLLHRSGRFTRPFWEGLERLIYYVLFPALLFNSLAKNRIDFGEAGPAMICAMGVIATGFVLGYLAKWILNPDPKIFASGLQTAFRFNSYIGLAVMSRLYGDAGLAAFGIVVAVAVPLANIGSVWALAKHSETSFFRELAQNPLLIATIAGVAWSFTGIAIPDAIGVTLTRMGAASLAAGLLAVGAALTLESAGKNTPVIAWFLAVKMAALPVAAWMLATAFGVTGVYFNVLVLYGALPTATSAYVLAVRMGGDGKSVALIISVSTLLGMVTLPIAVAMLSRG